jgi:NitT/TauT family transport system permease protein
MALGEMARSGELTRDIRVSVWRAAVGWLLGSFAAVGVGLVTGRIEAVREFVAPIIQLFRPLPPVAIIPVIIVWFGIGEISKVFSIAFAVFFPVWINAHVGSQRIPNSFLWSARTLKVKRLTILWKVIFPGALPFIVAGFRTGIAIAFIMVFVSELAGASAGLGYQISVSHLAYRVDRMMGALVVLGLLGALADLVMTKLLDMTFPWLKFASQK